MELQFSPKYADYLCISVHQSKKQEETLETIVPDSYPDVQRILCASAVAMVRSRESHHGSAAVSGGINVRALYMAEGETVPRCLENYLPFHVKVDAPGLTDESRIVFRIHVLSVDVRMLNSRKIVLRVNLCWELTAYDPCRQTLYTLEQQPASLQIKHAAYDLTLPVETAESTFQIMEELRLPAARPMTGELFQFLPRLEITEKRLAGNKAVFKGIAHLRMLYGAGDQMAVHEAELPFSQFCQLQEVYEEDELELAVVLTGCEADKSLQPDAESIRVTLDLLVQCVVKSKKRVQMLEDAYCTDGEFTPQWAQCEFPSRLDHQTASHMVRESREGDVSDVLQVWTAQDLPEILRQNDGVAVNTPVMVSVLYLDGQKQPHFMGFRTEVQEHMKLSENAKCHAWCPTLGDVTAVPTGSGLEIRFPMEVTTECYTDGSYRTLSGGEIHTREGKRPQRPAVIVRRTRSGETLWDIAKKNNTTVEKIRRANGMDADVTETGVLLIPT